MKKFLMGCLSLVLIVGTTFGLTSCFGDGNKGDVESNEYNIVMTTSTVPPTLAGIDIVKNGNKTYAWLERSATFAGIDS
ncbi:MAG: hypothetical protein ACI4TX_00230, partial [Christensenellales bacterium]